MPLWSLELVHLGIKGDRWLARSGAGRGVSEALCTQSPVAHTPALLLRQALSTLETPGCSHVSFLPSSPSAISSPSFLPSFLYSPPPLPLPSFLPSFPSSLPSPSPSCLALLLQAGGLPNNSWWPGLTPPAPSLGSGRPAQRGGIFYVPPLCSLFLLWKPLLSFL